MKQALCTMIMMLAVACTACGADSLPAEVESLLHSRQVLGTVRFAVGSAALNASARKEIDRIVPGLRKIDGTKQIVRIEGFASPGGSDDLNVSISMLRAKAVVDYLHLKHKLASDLFLTGYGIREGGERSKDTGGRAEFAIYDSTWDFGQIVVEQALVR